MSKLIAKICTLFFNKLSLKGFISVSGERSYEFISASFFFFSSLFTTAPLRLLLRLFTDHSFFPSFPHSVPPAVLFDGSIFHIDQSQTVIISQNGKARIYIYKNSYLIVLNFLPKTCTKM